MELYDEQMATVNDPMLEEGGTQPNGGSRYQEKRRLTGREKARKWCQENALLLATIAAVVLGLIFGFAIRLADPSDLAIYLIKFPGDLLIRMLKMLIIPLIVSSLVAGLAQLNPRACGRMGLAAILYYAMTTLSAIILGVILVVAIHPGDPAIKNITVTEGETDVSQGKISTLDAFLDLIRNLFPENIVAACFRQVKTRYKEPKAQPATELVTTNNPNGTNITDMGVSAKTIFSGERKVVDIDGMNVLGLISFCIGFGIVLSRLQDRAPTVVKFFLEFNEIIMKLIEIIMWFSPIGIFSLIVGNLLAIDNLALVAKTLGMYMVTVCVGLIIHGGIVLPAIYLVAVRKNPFLFMKGMLQAWLTALGTASSSATLPITFKCLENNNNIDPRVTRFVLPIGATVNMDGTALYEAVAAIFIAQLNAVPLPFGKILTISLTSTLASVGAASIPSAGLVTMVMVLIAADLPPEDIGIIFTVDWLLDRFRTSINVLGDAYGAGIVHHLCIASLEKHEETQPTAGDNSGGSDENDNAERRGEWETKA